MIATVDDLERIAAHDDADVPALSGWRRELFGEKALALKHGELALAIERGKVAAVEREEPRIAGVKRAIASLDRGEGVPHQEVKDWVKSWGRKRKRAAPRRSET